MMIKENPNELVIGGLAFFEPDFTYLKTKALSGVKALRSFETMKFFPNESSYAYFWKLIDTIKSKEWGDAEADNFLRNIYYDSDYVRYVKSVMLDDGKEGKKSIHVIVNDVMNTKINPNIALEEKIPLTPQATTSTNPIADAFIKGDDYVKKYKEEVAKYYSQVQAFEKLKPYIIGGGILLVFLLINPYLKTLNLYAQKKIAKKEEANA